MALSHGHIGLKISAKIKIYLLRRAKLLFHFAMRYPVSTFVEEHQVITAVCTGWNTQIWKKVQVNILKEPLLVHKQIIPHKKALLFSFHMTA